ncbi:MAG: hypothetical protein B0W54_14230 [Cellvibrio sp. 79]|nr:MAG: hypothetical protein B0W54_14230 [Cellvibrio sp. 79]
MNWFMAFLHHLVAFILVATLVYEWLLIRKPITLERARSLINTDRIYGASAMLLLIIGGLRLFYFEKGTQYYFHSIPFIIKLILFAVVGILSIYPTVTFQRWQQGLSRQQVPVIHEKTLRLLQRIITFELICITGILLGAAMAAKGAGYIS